MHSRLASSPATALAREFLPSSNPISIYASITRTRHVTPVRYRSLAFHRPCARFSTDTRGVERTPDGFVSSKPGQRNMRPMDTSQKRLSQESWVELLDPYLPLEIRSKGWLENLAAFEGVRPIDTLPSLLIEARQAFKLGLLSYISVDQGRWSAWLWLVKELLACEVPEQIGLRNLLGNRSSIYGSGTLDDFTNNIWFSDVPTLSFLPATLETLTGHQGSKESTARRIEMQEAVGQVWQSLARIMIEAADSEIDRRKDMMSYALHMIALLHHYNWIPPSIYNNESAVSSGSLRKPPLLELLSTRILDILSDSAWKAHEQQGVAEAASVGAQHVYKGRELHVTEIQPRIPPLGAATWLEFILWACVESSMIPDAARIIGEVVKRRGERKWKVIGWNALQASTLDKRSAATRMKPGLIQWWLNNLAGVSEGYNDELPSLEMDERTVSSEVTANILDGLVSSIRHGDDKSGLRPAAVRHYINMCKALLDRQASALDPTFYDSIMLRLIDYDYYPPASLPKVLNRVLDLSKREQKDIRRIQETNGYAIVVDHSPASIGLLHQVLDAYCRIGDIVNALRAFRRLQNWLQDNRRRVQVELSKSSATSSSSMMLDGNNDSSGLSYQIPSPTLAAFLDLLTDAQEYDIGKSLLYSAEVGGPAIPAHLYNSPTLQPSLLKLATATEDSRLLDAVTTLMAKHLGTFSEYALRSILHCQIKLHKWPEVDELLTYLTKERSLKISAYDIMVLAGTVLRLLAGKPDSKIHRTQISRAQDMLLKVLYSDVYRTLPDLSQIRDFSELREINQCGRILSQVPALQHAMALLFNDKEQSGQAHAPVAIPVNAFNILLKAIVETSGSESGRAIFDMWCNIPEHMGSETDHVIHYAEGVVTTQSRLQMLERVVTPNIQTVRIIIEPLQGSQLSTLTSVGRSHSLPSGESAPVERNPVPDLQSESEEDHTEQTTSMASTLRKLNWDLSPAHQESQLALIEWGISKYQQMGLSDAEIDIIIPGSCPEAVETTGNRDEPVKNMLVLTA